MPRRYGLFTLGQRHLAARSLLARRGYFDERRAERWGFAKARPRSACDFISRFTIGICDARRWWWLLYFRCGTDDEPPAHTPSHTAAVTPRYRRILCRPWRPAYFGTSTADAQYTANFARRGWYADWCAAVYCHMRAAAMVHWWDVSRLGHGDWNYRYMSSPPWRLAHEFRSCLWKYWYEGYYREWHYEWCIFLVRPPRRISLWLCTYATFMKASKELGWWEGRRRDDAHMKMLEPLDFGMTLSQEVCLRLLYRERVVCRRCRLRPPPLRNGRFTAIQIFDMSIWEAREMAITHTFAGFRVRLATPCNYWQYLLGGRWRRYDRQHAGDDWRYEAEWSWYWEISFCLPRCFTQAFLYMMRHVIIIEGWGLPSTALRFLRFSGWCWFACEYFENMSKMTE